MEIQYSKRAYVHINYHENYMLSASLDSRGDEVDVTQPSPLRKVGWLQKVEHGLLVVKSEPRILGMKYYSIEIISDLGLAKPPVEL